MVQPEVLREAVAHEHDGARHLLGVRQRPRSAREREEEALVGRAGEKRNAGPFVPLGGNSIGYLAA